MSILLNIIALEFKLAFRSGGQWLSQLMLFILMVTLVPFGTGVNQAVLQSVVVGFVWVGLLLSTALSISGVYQKDWENGHLEQYLLGRDGAPFTILGKTISFWLISTIPLALISPVLASMLFVDIAKAWGLIPSLLLGGLSCTLIGSLAAALLIGNQRAGGIMVLLVLPLYIPVIIFGALASGKAMVGELFSSEFTMLAGLALLLAPLSIWGQTHLVRKACE